MKNKIAKVVHHDATSQMVSEVDRFPRLAESGEDKLTTERAKLEGEVFKAIDLYGKARSFYAKARLHLGRRFLRLKATFNHGEWENYYEKTFGKSCVSCRSARRYMKLAAEADEDSKTVSLAVLKPGTDQHAVNMRRATEKARTVVGDAREPEAPVYKLPLHLSAEQRQATVLLWSSRHRRSAERETVALLERLCNKYLALKLKVEST